MQPSFNYSLIHCKYLLIYLCKTIKTHTKNKYHEKESRHFGNPRI